MPYHVKAAVNHMHYCSSAYINRYEIFLGKNVHMLVEKLSALFLNKVGYSQIIFIKSLSDFLLLVNKDGVFPKPPCTWRTEVSPAVWGMSVACSRVGGQLGEPSKTGVIASAQHWLRWLHCFGTQDLSSSWHCTLQYQPISSSVANMAIPDTAVLPCSSLGFHLGFFFSSFERETERSVTS